MKRIKGKLCITIFAAVMGFVAGAATDIGGGYMNEALKTMGSVEGITLLGIAVTGMLFNGTLFSWSSIAIGNIGKITASMSLLIKTMLVGLMCRELTIGFNALNALLMMLTVLGGGCICAAFLMNREQKNEKAKRMAVWLCGVAAEDIIIPSVARTWALLFM